VLVCGGVLLLPRLERTKGNRFQMPYISGKFIIPAMVILFIIGFRLRVMDAVTNISNENHQEIFFLVFLLLAIAGAILTFIRNYSLIPVLGALCCMYLLIEIPVVSWLWFFCLDGRRSNHIFHL
jgi:hypothetical protein